MARETSKTADPRLARGSSDHYLDAELYDFEYATRRHDVAFYRTLARRSCPDGGRILELGAGTGRVTLPLLDDGHEVHALERMPQMAARLRERAAESGATGRLRVIEGDMRSLATALVPGIDFDLVIAPFNALMHLYAWSDLLACFRGVRERLRPTASFAFDVLLPDLEWLGWDPNLRHSVTRFRHPRTGETLIYSTNHVYDPATQICHVRIYYDRAPAPGRRFRPPARPHRLVLLAHRQIFPEELRLLVDAAGLVLERHDGDFGGRPLATRKSPNPKTNPNKNVESQVCVCRRAPVPGDDPAVR